MLHSYKYILGVGGCSGVGLVCKGSIELDIFENDFLFFCIHLLIDAKRMKIKFKIHLFNNHATSMGGKTD